jgi:hypothetical protein
VKDIAQLIVLCSSLFYLQNARFVVEDWIFPLDRGLQYPLFLNGIDNYYDSYHMDNEDNIPMPAATRYWSAGQPSPPAPITITDALRNLS